MKIKMNLPITNKQYTYTGGDTGKFHDLDLNIMFDTREKTITQHIIHKCNQLFEGGEYLPHFIRDEFAKSGPDPFIIPQKYYQSVALDNSDTPDLFIGFIAFQESTKSPNLWPCFAWPTLEMAIESILAYRPKYFMYFFNSKVAKKCGGITEDKLKKLSRYYPNIYTHYFKELNIMETPKGILSNLTFKDTELPYLKKEAGIMDFILPIRKGVSEPLPQITSLSEAHTSFAKKESNKKQEDDDLGDDYETLETKDLYHIYDINKNNKLHPLYHHNIRYHWRVDRILKGKVNTLFHEDFFDVDKKTFTNWANNRTAKIRPHLGDLVPRVPVRFLRKAATKKVICDGNVLDRPEISIASFTQYLFVKNYFNSPFLMLDWDDKDVKYTFPRYLNYELYQKIKFMKHFSSDELSKEDGKLLSYHCEQRRFSKLPYASMNIRGNSEATNARNIIWYYSTIVADLVDFNHLFYYIVQAYREILSKKLNKK